MDPEERLRSHISQALAQAGVELSPAMAEEIENQIVALFREYARAPEGIEDEVYARGEAKILRSIDQMANSNSSMNSSVQG